MNKVLSRWYRIKYIPNLLLGYMLSFFFKHQLPNNIALVGGHMGELFDDNAKAMYNFLCKKSSQYTVYWCYSSNRNYDLKNLSGNKFLRIGSLKSYIVYFNAKVCFYSHSNSSDIAPIANHLPIRDHPYRVDISHGVEGLKRKTSGSLENAELYTCTSEFERLIKCDEWGVPDELAVVTGIARYDNYSITEAAPRAIKTILYMPTWREWEYNDDDKSFQNSVTYKRISSLLLNQKLRDELYKRNIELLVCLHPFFSKFRCMFEDYLSKNMKLTEKNISDLIMCSDILITDYSSVAFDFLYLKKSVIFYQYDQSTFLKLRGSYIDYSTGLFGDICTEEDQLIKALDKIYLNNNFNHEQLLSKYFPFRDNNNCERIFKTVQNRLSNTQNYNY